MVLPEENGVKTCSICKGTNTQPHAEKAGISFAKCVDCGYVVADPLPSPAELDELYGRAHFESSYHPESAANQELFEKRKDQYLLDRDLFLEFRDSGRLLDFGCGNGLFLSVFPDTFEKYGYEKNPVTTDWIRENGSFRVFTDEAELRAIEPGFFDAIMMRGVIEHLIDPETTLAMLAERLRVGGEFYICATPNMDSPGALLYGTQWNQFTPPFHLHYFSPRTLAVLGARHGLALVECRSPYLGTPYEHEPDDGQRFCRDVDAVESGATLTASPPFPGTMMSLVFRKTR